MAATTNSVYQAIRVNHVNNVPPNCYPQTDLETFGQYQIRMASQGLPPDINPTESDTDYLVRLASYQPTPPTLNATASYCLVSQAALLATSATTSSFSSRVRAADVAGNVASASFALRVVSSSIA